MASTRTRIGRLALLTGLLFSASALLQAGLAITGFYEPVQGYRDPFTTALSELAIALTDLFVAIGLLMSVTLLVAWFPDGRPMSRLGRFVPALLALAAVALIVSAVGTNAMPIIRWSAELEGIIGTSEAAAFLSVGAAYVLANVDLVLRYRRADPLRRVQMRWVLAAVAVGIIGTALVTQLSGQVEGLWGPWVLSTMLPVLAIGIAITRYHLYDIDRIVSRSIGYAVVTAVLFVVFALVNVAVRRHSHGSCRTRRR